MVANHGGVTLHTRTTYTYMPFPSINASNAYTHTPQHTYTQVSSFFPDELYQGYMTGLPGGKWLTLQLPFRDMTLTRLGRFSYVQRDLDGAFKLESIGGRTGLHACHANDRLSCHRPDPPPFRILPPRAPPPSSPPYSPRHRTNEHSTITTGFLIADGQSGPFRLEIGGVAAVGAITGRAPDAAALSPSGTGGEEGGGRGDERRKEREA